MSKKTRKKQLTKTKSLKTKETRLQEITKVKNQLRSIGFSTSNPDIQEAYKIMDDYVDFGSAFTGKVKINGFKRVLEMILSNRAHIQSTICLKHNENV